MVINFILGYYLLNILNIFLKINLGINSLPLI